MDYNDLSHTVDVLLTECEADFEPSFNRQAEAIRQWESTIYNNIDSISTLERRLDGVSRDQSELDVSVWLIGEKLSELEQTIIRLERCPQEVALPWRAGSWPSATSSLSSSSSSRCCSSQQGSAVNPIAVRNKIYRTLLEVASRMDDPDRDWPPEADRLKVMIEEHRRCYDKHFPAIGVLACHTETLTAIERQLHAIEDRLAANGKHFLEFGLRGERCWLGDYLLSNK